MQLRGRNVPAARPARARHAVGGGARGAAIIPVPPPHPGVGGAVPVVAAAGGPFLAPPGVPPPAAPVAAVAPAVPAAAAAAPLHVPAPAPAIPALVQAPPYAGIPAAGTSHPLLSTAVAGLPTLTTAEAFPPHHTRDVQDLRLRWDMSPLLHALSAHDQKTILMSKLDNDILAAIHHAVPAPNTVQEIFDFLVRSYSLPPATIDQQRNIMQRPSEEISSYVNRFRAIRSRADDTTRISESEAVAALIRGLSAEHAALRELAATNPPANLQACIDLLSNWAKNRQRFLPHQLIGVHYVDPFASFPSHVPPLAYGSAISSSVLPYPFAAPPPVVPAPPAAAPISVPPESFYVDSTSSSSASGSHSSDSPALNRDLANELIGQFNHRLDDRFRDLERRIGRQARFGRDGRDGRGDPQRFSRYRDGSSFEFQRRPRNNAYQHNRDAGRDRGRDRRGQGAPRRYSGDPLHIDLNNRPRRPRDDEDEFNDDRSRHLNANRAA